VSPAHPAAVDLSALAASLAAAGVERASMVELARAAHVAKPTLYARFGSRQGLVQACVEHEAERLLDHVYGRDVGAGLAAYAGESPGWRLLLVAGHPAAVAARSRVAARIAQGRQGIPGLRPRLAASAFLADRAGGRAGRGRGARAALPGRRAAALRGHTEAWARLGMRPAAKDRRT
jgi:AcrR family transcriptional regulator